MQSLAFSIFFFIAESQKICDPSDMMKTPKGAGTEFGLMKCGPIFRILSSGDLDICCPVALALFTVIVGEASMFSVQAVIIV